MACSFDAALNTIDALISNTKLSNKREGLLSIKTRIERMRDTAKAQASAGSYDKVAGEKIAKAAQKPQKDTRTSTTRSNFTVQPKAAPDAVKAPYKASRATKYIGYGAEGSSTALYAQQLKQQGMPINSGKYTANDVVFVSVNGKPTAGNFVSTLNEVLKALDAGATVLTDSAAYLGNSTYNKGEKELAAELLERGYIRTTSKGNKDVAEWTKSVTASTSDYTFTKEKDGYIVTNNTPNKTFVISGGSAGSAEASRKVALYPVTKFNGGIDSAADSQELLVHIKNGGIVSTADAHELEQVNNKLIAARTSLFDSKIKEQKMAKDRWLELAAEVLNLAATLQNLQERILQKYMLPSMKLTVNTGVNSDPVLYERIPQRLVKDPKEKQADTKPNSDIMDKAKAIGVELGLRDELVNETIAKLEKCSKG